MAAVGCCRSRPRLRPWAATPELARVLRPGGVIYVETHQTFPIHGYPSDYWRFTREALELLALDAGLEVIGTAYKYPATIVPASDINFERGWNASAPAFLNVELLAVRR